MSRLSQALVIGVAIKALAGLALATTIVVGTGAMDMCALFSCKIGGQLAGSNPHHGLYTIFTTTPVPEPAGWALLFAGFGLLGANLRDRKKLGKSKMRVRF